MHYAVTSLHSGKVTLVKLDVNMNKVYWRNVEESEVIIVAVERVVIKADLLRYEVTLIIFQNKIGRKDIFSVYVELTLPNNACI